MPPTDLDYNTDWIYVPRPLSNIHVATRKEWFIPSTLTHFRSFFSNAYTLCEVAAVGDVVLPVKTLNSDDEIITGAITLRDVLYCPTGMPCNIIGAFLPENVKTVDLDPSIKLGKFLDGDDNCMAILEKMSLWKVVLANQDVGISSMGETEYACKAVWSDAERNRWKLRKEKREREINAAKEASDVPCYTYEEEEFMLTKYGNEEIFLRNQALDINSEKDRASGRGILRSLKAGWEYSVQSEIQAGKMWQS